MKTTSKQKTSKQTHNQPSTRTTIERNKETKKQTKGENTLSNLVQFQQRPRTVGVKLQLDVLDADELPLDAFQKKLVC